MPRVRPLSSTHDAAPRRQTIHLLGCNCIDCLPPSPTDRDYHLKAAAETIACLVVGGVSAWLLDWALGGPGIQIMVGL